MSTENVIKERQKRKFDIMSKPNQKSFGLAGVFLEDLE